MVGGWRDCRLFYASVGVILLPEEAMTLFPEEHAMYLAAMLGVAVSTFVFHLFSFSLSIYEIP